MQSHIFDMLVAKSGDGYFSRVLQSPRGEATEAFTLDGFPIEKSSEIITPSAGQASGAESDLQRLGAALFDRIFLRTVGEVFARCLDFVNMSETGLNVRLRLDPAVEKLGIPWEILYCRQIEQFLALSTRTALSRYNELPIPRPRVSVGGSIRILAVVSAPQEFDPINVEREWKQIDTALENLTRNSIATVERLGSPELGALDEAIAQGNYNILHIACHGEADPESGDFYLLLSGPQGTRRVSPQELALVVGQSGSLRLAFINACLGASTASLNGPSLAHTLARIGLPAIVAMQAPVSDSSALVFSQAFYRALAVGKSIDAAVNLARRRVFLECSKTEWAIPALFIRTDDSQLLDLRNGEELIAPTPYNKPGRERSDATRSGASSGTFDSHKSIGQRLMAAFVKDLGASLLGSFIVSAVILPLVLSILKWFSVGRQEIPIPWYGNSYILGIEVALYFVLGAGLATAAPYMSWLALTGMTIGLGAGAGVAVLAITADALTIPTIGSWILALGVVEFLIYMASAIHRRIRRAIRQRRRI